LQHTVYVYMHIKEFTKTSNTGSKVPGKGSSSAVKSVVGGLDPAAYSLRVNARS
jgi:hypothetical protein